MKREEQQRYAHLSPFEIKDKLIALAAEHQKRNTHILLNAGRANPNWLATTPREAFFTLGQFAMAESRHSFESPHLGGMPLAEGMADRFERWAREHPDAAGIDFLQTALNYGVEVLGMDRQALLYELVDSILGDQYPTPPRLGTYIEKIVQAYLLREMGSDSPSQGQYDLFAVEGATAAICYLFNSLIENRLLHWGDTIALGLPIFTPYLELPQLQNYHFKVIEVMAEEGDRWQYPASEIAKLADPNIKVFFLVNPSNPPSYALHPSSLDQIRDLVQSCRPDLMIITDDVYATFVNGFRSLLTVLPHQTIGVYSYSKYFGCTGWRLGVIALHEHNIFDQQLAHLSRTDQTALNHRYHHISLNPVALKFIDRVVADSRQVALNHTAGLPLPQQVQMALFSLFALVDTENDYKQTIQAILHRRLQALYQGLGIAESQPDPLYARYYATLNLENWMQQQYGKAFMAFVKRNYEPLDVVFRLAEQFSTVLLHGRGFDAPDWSVRVSLANLPDDAYKPIGEYIRLILQQYLDAWQAAGSPAE